MNEKVRLLKMAEMYFDAELTAAQEDELRRAVVSGMAASDHDFDELRAVMGYFSAGSAVESAGKEEDIAESKGHIRRVAWKWVSVAAAIVALIAVGMRGYALHTENEVRATLAEMLLDDGGVDVQSEILEIFGENY